MTEYHIKRYKVEQDRSRKEKTERKLIKLGLKLWSDEVSFVQRRRLKKLFTISILIHIMENFISFQKLYPGEVVAQKNGKQSYLSGENFPLMFIKKGEKRLEIDVTIYSVSSFEFMPGARKLRILIRRIKKQFINRK